MFGRRQIDDVLSVFTAQASWISQSLKLVAVTLRWAIGKSIDPARFFAEVSSFQKSGQRPLLREFPFPASHPGSGNGSCEGSGDIG